MPPALRLILLGHVQNSGPDGDFPRMADYFAAVEQALFGDEADAAGAKREYWLDTRKKTSAKQRVHAPSRSFLDGALHTLVVALVTREFVEDEGAVRGLEDLAEAVHGSKGRHSLILYATSEQVSGDLRDRCRRGAQLPSLQGPSLETLGERAQRPTSLALRALARAHRLLVGKGEVRLFVSHAKVDGLPLAASLRHIIDGYDFLRTFYDAQNIGPGEDFRDVLRDGVASSMLIALRTDIYDERFWCRQEVMWAEEFDQPILLVNARVQMVNRPSVLGFSGVPTVSVADGNVLRILVEALREWVRIAAFRSRTAEVLNADDRLKKPQRLRERVETICRPPSPTALAAALSRLEERKAPPDALVVHAGPPLESGFLEAAKALVQTKFPAGTVMPAREFFSNYTF